MGTTTTKGQLPRPASGDDNDTPADLIALTDRLDAILGIETFTTTQRDALAANQRWNLRVIGNTTTNTLQVRVGSSWVDLAFDADLDAVAALVTALEAEVDALPPGILAMSTATRDALTGGALGNGRIIYNTTNKRHEWYSTVETKWKPLVDTGMSAFLTSVL